MPSQRHNVVPLIQQTVETYIPEAPQQITNIIMVGDYRVQPSQQEPTLPPFWTPYGSPFVPSGYFKYAQNIVLH